MSKIGLTEWMGLALPALASASGVPYSRIDFSPISGAAWTGSLIVAASYFLWVVLGRKARLLLIEVVFVVEDGFKIVESIERCRAKALHGRTAGMALAEWVGLLRASRLLDGVLTIRKESYSNAALSADAVDLERQQAAIVALRESAGHRRCIVGLIYTLDIFGDLRSGCYDEALAHLAFLHENRPVDVGCLHAYYGALADGDDGEEFVEELGHTLLRLHSPDLDAV